MANMPVHSEPWKQAQACFEKAAGASQDTSALVSMSLKAHKRIPNVSLSSTRKTFGSPRY